MFDVGFFELVIIGIVALLVFGPQRLPELARTAGRWMSRARNMVWAVRREVEREFNATELRESTRDLDPARLKNWLDPEHKPSPPITPSAADPPKAEQ